MTGSETDQRALTELNALRHNRFYYGKLMGVLQFSMEQQRAFSQQMLFGRLGFGSGVVCGLDVTPITSEGQRGLRISRGLAIDGWGRSIVVPQDHDLIPLSLTDDCGAPRPDGTLTYPFHVALCYEECLTDHAPALVVDPACDDRRSREGGTWIETYCVKVLPGLAPRPTRPTCTDEVLAHLRARRIQDAMCTLADTCPEEPDDPCIVLADVSQASDGTLTVDACSPRAVAPSNWLLLDLITCLAARVEECCGAAPTPTPRPTPLPTPTPAPTPPPAPTPTPTPPPRPTLRVAAIRLYDLGEAGFESTTAAPVFTMDPPRSPITVAVPFDTIEVVFAPDAHPNYLTIIAQKTFVVTEAPEGPKITPMPSVNGVRYSSRGRFRPGQRYHVGLRDKIAATDGSALDGEFPSGPTAQWPSGDGVPGGSFEFDIDVS